MTLPPIKPEIRDVLLRLSDDRLAHIYKEINSWVWPKELKKWAPKNWSRANTKQNAKQLNFGLEIMRYIQFVVGEKKTSRAWNSDMTNQEFEEWYSKDRYKCLSDEIYEDDIDILNLE